MISSMVIHNAPITNLLVQELIQIKTNHLSLFADTEMHERNVLQGVEKDARNDESIR